MTSGPVPNSALADEIATSLLSLIREKQLLPGDKLPQERDLSSMNIIDIHQGDGTYASSQGCNHVNRRKRLTKAIRPDTVVQLS